MPAPAVVEQYNKLQAESGKEGTLLIDRTDAVHCPCGCKGRAGKAGKFIPGHDARLKGMLILAATQGHSFIVKETSEDGKVVDTTHTAETLAESRGWGDMIKRGVEVAREADARKSANAEAKEKAKAEKGKGKADKLMDTLSGGIVVGEEGTVTYRGKQHRAIVREVNTVDLKLKVDVLKADGSVLAENVDSPIKGFVKDEAQAEAAAE